MYDFESDVTPASNTSAANDDFQSLRWCFCFIGCSGVFQNLQVQKRLKMDTQDNLLSHNSAKRCQSSNSSRPMDCAAEK